MNPLYLQVGWPADLVPAAPVNLYQPGPAQSGWRDFSSEQSPHTRLFSRALQPAAAGVDR